jgi:hypothetical protein
MAKSNADFGSTRRLTPAARLSLSLRSKNTKRESNPHFRPGKAAGCRYIMDAFLS